MEPSELAVLKQLHAESNSECSGHLSSTLTNSHTHKHVFRSYLHILYPRHDADIVIVVT